MPEDRVDLLPEHHPVSSLNCSCPGSLRRTILFLYLKAIAEVQEPLVWEGTAAAEDVLFYMQMEKVLDSDPDSILTSLLTGEEEIL